DVVLTPPVLDGTEVDVHHRHLDALRLGRLSLRYPGQADDGADGRHAREQLGFHPSPPHHENASVALPLPGLNEPCEPAHRRSRGRSPAVPRRALSGGPTPTWESPR